MPSPTRAFARALRFAAPALLLAPAARALPPLTLHDDTTPGIVTWQSVANPAFNPLTDAHQHWKNQDLFGVPNVFKTYSVWDNNQYRYNAALDQPRLKANGDAADYGHGYMATPAQFYVRSNVGAGQTFPLGAQADFLTAMSQWHANVNQVGMLNSNNVPVQTRIDFNHFGTGANPDPDPRVIVPGANLEIRFDTRFLRGGAANPVPVDFPIDSQITDPLAGGGGGGGTGLDGTLAWWTPSLRILTFNANVAWYFSQGNNNDLNPNIAGGQFDFYSVALHEIGHVLGLDHIEMPGGPSQTVANTTMFPGIPRRGGYFDVNANITYSGIRRGIDLNTVDGARGLYTIPAPGTIGLLAGAGALAGRRRRR